MAWPWNNSSGTHDSKSQQRGAFIKNMLSGTSMVSVAVLILTGPDFLYYTEDFVWGFLWKRYPEALVPFAFFGVYAAAYPAMFFFMRASWTNSASLAVLWLADKIF